MSWRHQLKYLSTLVNKIIIDYIDEFYIYF